LRQANHAEKVQKLRTALNERAKREPGLRFYSLYDKVCREDVLAHSYALCRANKGAAGPDGITFEDIEGSGGPGSMLARLAEELKTKRYTPGPVRRVYIPKANGGERPLGIPIRAANNINVQEGALGNGHDHTADPSVGRA
jgi:hypothetical protein